MLLVDDYPDALELYSVVLTGLGFDVATASSGRAALAAADAARPDVVVMDLFMPNMDGWETTRRIRERHPDVPVIALSARPVADADDGRSLFVRMCSKPCLPDALARIITNVIDDARRRQSVS